MPESRSGIFRVMRGFLKWILIIVVVLAVLYGLLDFLGARKEKSVRARWAQSVGSLEEFQKGIPETKKNSEAQALEALAAKMGLAQEEAKPPWKDVKSPLYDYVKTELDKPTSDVQPPPAAVASFLRDQREDIAALRQQLVNGATPKWDERRTGLYQAPLPRILPIIEMQRLLAADALEALQCGEKDRAAEDLEASWKLQEALSHRPELISVLVRAALVRLEAGVLRKFDGAPAAWDERLGSYDPKAELLNGYRYEACATLEIGDPGRARTPVLEGNWLQRRLSSRLTLPYLRLCAAGSADVLLDFVEAVRDAGPCSLDLTAKITPIFKKIPWWNAIARVAVPDVAPSQYRAGRTRVDVELTRKILEARATRDKNGGKWATAIAGIEDSVCKGEKWSYAVSGDKMTFAYSKELPAPPSQPFVLPLKFEEVIQPVAPKRGK
jgi:hypothetical protein